MTNGRKFNKFEKKTCMKIQAKIRWAMESIETNIPDCQERRELLEKLTDAAFGVGYAIAAVGIVEREKAE